MIPDGSREKKGGGDETCIPIAQMLSDSAWDFKDTPFIPLFSLHVLRHALRFEGKNASVHILLFDGHPKLYCVPNSFP